MLTCLTGHEFWLGFNIKCVYDVNNKVKCRKLFREGIRGTKITSTHETHDLCKKNPRKILRKMPQDKTVVGSYMARGSLSIYFLNNFDYIVTTFYMKP